jgi:hypothetical protein
VSFETLAALAPQEQGLRRRVPEEGRFLRPVSKGARFGFTLAPRKLPVALDFAE